MSYISVPPGNPALPPWFELEAPAPRAARGQLQNALYRNRWLGLALVVTCVALAAFATWWVKPYYLADGSIIIEHPSLHNAELTPREYPPPVDADRELETELTVMASRTVSEPVIARLNLERRDPEIHRALDNLGVTLAKRRLTASATLKSAIAVGVFSSKLKLLPDKLSSTVHVEYGSGDPVLAAQVVNAVTAQYVTAELAQRAESGQGASRWMRGQLAAAQAELARDDDAVAQFQQAHAFLPLPESGGMSSALLARLADANHAWSTAEGERIADEAQVRSYGNGSSGVVAALPADLRNPAIDQASANLGSAEQQLAALETTYRSDFPLVVEAQAQVRGAQQRLAGLRSQVAAGLAQRLAASQQREQELAARVTTLSHEAALASGVEMQFGVVKAKADGQRALVTTLAEKLNEVELEASLPPANIHILDAALTPLTPAYPKVPLDLGLGLGVGVIVALGVALGRERWQKALTQPHLVKLGLGEALAPLGMIADQPRLPRATRGLLPAAAGAGRPDYAKVAANLVARAGPPPRALLVTSANAGDGKTTMVCQLGLALAQAGWRTLVVDADTRNPRCHTFFGMPSPGPENAASARMEAPASGSNSSGAAIGAPAGLRAAEQGRKVPPVAVALHLDLMPCEAGGPPLQARTMAALLEQWRQHYDYILVDSPPGNMTGEAVLLSSLVEGVLVVLRWGHTRLPEAQQLCEELARARAPLLGTVLNRADPGAPAFRPYRARPVEAHA
ncbi:MAG TPA: hypothetical protein VN709_01320 [Terriglobales bacterium]|nr:hypothetical protein [Terriglobales bacterium]